MKNQNHYIHGDWNAVCDRCGFKYKASDLKKEWTGLRVCKPCFDERHPSDFYKARPDSEAIPWSRPEATDTYVTVVSHGALNPSGGGGTGTSLSNTNANFQYTNGSPGTYSRFNTTTETYESSNFFTGFEPIESI